MKTIKINIITNTSTIVVGESLNNMSNYIDDIKKTVIITDENVNKFYENSFPLECKKIIIGIGEDIKTLQTVEQIYKKLIEYEVDRSFFIVGIGGGVVCDITGFVSSTYMRGVEFGFISTTLLSQVDASVGGKNGVNLLNYKNMIGVFSQPKFVICDLNMLSTLPKKEYTSGIAEIIKHGIISSKEHFEYIENNYKKILLGSNKNILEKIIYDSINIKVDIVQKDEKENGERKKLNFGHSFGHAIERIEKIPHGEAVSIGIIIASKISLDKGYISNIDFNRILNLIKKLNLPFEFKSSKQEILNIILKDKKRNGSFLDMILIEGIGKARIEKISYNEIYKIFRNFQL